MMEKSNYFGSQLQVMFIRSICTYNIATTKYSYTARVHMTIDRKIYDLSDRLCFRH